MSPFLQSILPLNKKRLSIWDSAIRIKGYGQEEIANRIEENFGLPVHVTTFHSLGYEYIKEIS